MYVACCTILFMLIGTLSLIPQIQSSGLVYQNFTSSSRVSLTLNFLDEFRHPLFGTLNSPPLQINLTPYKTHSAVIPLQNFIPNLQYTAIVTNSTTDQVLISHIERTIRLQNGMEWIEDIISNGQIIIKVQSIYKCDSGLSGPMCDKKCDNIALKSGRKRCDVLGRTRCDYGWMGTKCSKTIDPRKCGCRNSGICVSSMNHDAILPTINTNDQLICECPSGFAGDKCEIVLSSNSIAPKSSVCQSKDSCLNGAECVANGPVAFCACRHGFVGEYCEIQMNLDSTLSSASDQSYSTFNFIILIVSILTILLILFAACFTHKFKPHRNQALTRLQLPQYRNPNEISNKSMLVTKDVAAKVYTIESMNSSIELYERYTSAPKNVENNVEYAVISKVPPPPPSHQPPPTPR